MHAPVRVARSTIASGRASEASDRASARISRPSASVLTTSMVLPLRIFSTSPGRVASPPSMLSVMGRKARTRTGGASAPITDMAPITAAAPAMSIFMVSMPAIVLMLRPPESKVTPLPTNASEPLALPSGRWSSSTNRGGLVLPRFTPSSPPSLRRLISASVHTFTPSPAERPISAVRAARAGAVSEPPGSFTRSRARHWPAATAVPRSISPRARAPALPATSTRRSLASAGSDFKAVKL